MVQSVLHTILTTYVHNRCCEIIVQACMKRSTSCATTTAAGSTTAAASSKVLFMSMLREYVYCVFLRTLQCTKTLLLQALQLASQHGTSTCSYLRCGAVQIATAWLAVSVVCHE
jgi:hypothetical protein